MSGNEPSRDGSTIDAALLAQADSKAKQAYSWNKLVNFFLSLSSIASGAVFFVQYERPDDGYSLDNKYSILPRWVIFIIFVIIVWVLLSRLKRYRTFIAFVRTKAAEKPDSYFALLDIKHRVDAQKAHDALVKQRTVQSQTEKKFNAEVANELMKHKALQGPLVARPAEAEISSAAPGGNARWRSLLKSDPDVARAARKVRRYGRSYENRFASAYQVLNDKSYLDALTKKFVDEAEAEQ